MARKVARKMGKVYNKSRKEVGENVCKKSSRKLDKSRQEMLEASRRESMKKN